MLCTLLFAAFVAALPAPQINNDQIYGTPVGPVGHSGQIYPTNSVLGPVNSLNPASAVSTGIVGPYTLVPNQDANPTLGLILDFTNTENPQPIRGDAGGDDPGPSMLTHLTVACLTIYRGPRDRSSKQ